MGVRDFKIYGDARCGDELICRLEKTDEVNGLNVCKAVVLKNGKTINDNTTLAEGELRIFETPA